MHFFPSAIKYYIKFPCMLWSDGVVSMTLKTNAVPTFTRGITVIYHMTLGG